MPGTSPSEYNPHDYPPFAVTVDMAVFTIRDDTLQVLLVERGEAPFKGVWALPGGFVREDEDLDEAAARELEEETGVTKEYAYLEQLRSYGKPGRDPRMRVITVAYWAVCPHLSAPKGGGDAARASLVPAAKVEHRSIELAFDHKQILRDALDRLRSKLEYTAVGAQFCPPEFTISELRRVYEAAWDTTLDPGNFQRNVRRSAYFKKAGSGHARRKRRVGRPASLWSTRGDYNSLASLSQPLASRRTYHEDDLE